jgi:hypothetical protein
MLSSILTLVVWHGDIVIETGYRVGWLGLGDQRCMRFNKTKPNWDHRFTKARPRRLTRARLAFISDSDHVSSRDAAPGRISDDLYAG